MDSMKEYTKAELEKLEEMIGEYALEEDKITELPDEFPTKE